MIHNQCKHIQLVMRPVSCLLPSISSITTDNRSCQDKKERRPNLNPEEGFVDASYQDWQSWMKKSWRKKQEELEIEDDKKTKKIIDRNQEAWEHKSVLERGESKEEDEVWIDD